MQGGRGGHNRLDRGNAWDPGVSGTKNFSKSWTKDVDGRPLLSEEDGEGAPLLNVYPRRSWSSGSTYQIFQVPLLRWGRAEQYVETGVGNTGQLVAFIRHGRRRCLRRIFPSSHPETTTQLLPTQQNQGSCAQPARSHSWPLPRSSGVDQMVLGTQGRWGGVGSLWADHNSRRSL